MNLAGEQSGWNEALGPLHAESYLIRHGIEDHENLIAITTTEGELLYPHRQFDEAPGGVLIPREATLRLWNSRLRPAIDNRDMPEYMAATYLLGIVGDGMSRSDEIEAEIVTVENVARDIQRMLSRFRQ
jgi:hypothetical protein